VGFPDVGMVHRSLGSNVMLVFGVIREFLWALGGLAFVSLVLALFVVLARFAAKHLLGDDDGSSLL